MEVVGFTLFLVGIVHIFAITLVSALFIWIGAKFAGIKGATLWRSFLVAIISGFPIWVTAGFGIFLMGFGPFLGWIIGTFIALCIIKSFFKTTWRKAFIAWILQAAAQYLLLGIMGIRTPNFFRLFFA